MLKCILPQTYLEFFVLVGAPIAQTGFLALTILQFGFCIALSLDVG